MTRRKGHLPAGLLIPLAAVVLVFFARPLWLPLELSTYDLRVRYSAPAATASHVVVVGIEDHEILAKKPFIFWYPDIGRLLTRIGAGGPAAVGCDLIPVHSLEQKLAESIPDLDAAAADGVRPSALIGRRLDAALVGGVMETARLVPLVQGVSGTLVPFYYDLLAFMDRVRPAALTVTPDTDGILRRQRLAVDGNVDPFPTALLRATRPEVAQRLPHEIAVDYGFFATLPRYSYDEVMAADFPLQRFAGKIVLLGLISAVDDVHRTPLGERPGVLVHAATIETVLAGSAPTPLPAAGGWLIALALSAAVFVAVVRLSLWRGALGAALGVVAVSVGAFWLFPRGTVLPLVPLALAPVVTCSLGAAYRYGVEARERRQLYQTFSYYVDTRVIDRIVARSGEGLMEGEEREACIMFLDIRNFTGMSARLPAKSIVALLNVLFGRITELVQEEQGLVNKFIGDGMLAFFIDERSGVDAALQASLKICRALDELNRRGDLAPFVGAEEVTVGIGLHAGRIILGNIGSRRKLDFTVIGQPVNMAARIESQTKEFGRRVLVSASVATAADPRFRFEPVGAAALKGIDGEVELYALALEAEA